MPFQDDELVPDLPFRISRKFECDEVAVSLRPSRTFKIQVTADENLFLLPPSRSWLWCWFWSLRLLPLLLLQSLLVDHFWVSLIAVHIEPPCRREHTGTFPAEDSAFRIVHRRSAIRRKERPAQPAPKTKGNFRMSVFVM